jgi:hypothetical protein
LKVTVSCSTPSEPATDFMYIMSSTPLIASSSGVATVSAITLGLAPGYTARTTTEGGTTSDGQQRDIRPAAKIDRQHGGEDRSAAGIASSPAAKITIDSHRGAGAPVRPDRPASMKNPVARRPDQQCCGLELAAAQQAHAGEQAGGEERGRRLSQHRARAHACRCCGSTWLSMKSTQVPRADNRSRSASAHAAPAPCRRVRCGRSPPPMAQRRKAVRRRRSSTNTLILRDHRGQHAGGVGLG